VLVLATLPIVLAVLGWIGKTRAIVIPPALGAWLTSSRWAPVLAGLVPALLTWFVWGSLYESGVVHDERAYLLQARIFAQGAWTGTPPPIASFFEQMHVFIDPRLAAKYPPGHALLLVPGIWLDLPGLVPVLLSGLSGGLIFLIARQVAGAVPALGGWLLWSTSVPSLTWRASYFSQTTCGLLWLLSLWALLRWRTNRRWHQLAIVVVATAWMYLTRPLTAVALGLPVGLVILWDLARDARLWRALGAALLLALPIVALNFTWQERTSGDWLTNPYSDYSRVYFPFDKPGFGVDPSPPQREIPEEIGWVGRQFLDVHRDHQPMALPLILLRQTIALLVLLSQTSMLFLIPLFVAGVVWARGPLLFGLLSMASMLLAYLAFAHPSDWIVYYFEVFPVFYVVAAAGAARLASAGFAIDVSRAHAVVALGLAIVLPWLAANVWMARQSNDSKSAFHRTAERMLATLPHEPAVVFVRYPEGHNFHRSIITNTPDYRVAPLWLVYDRGEKNAQLLQLTDRAAYCLDVGTWTLQKIR
jgi:dolichyl-phosphate-mannose-protein mannosyltransferase